MRGKFVAVVTILIFETSNLAIAQDQFPNKDELLQKVLEPGNISSIADFNVSSINTADAEKLAKEKCEKNGGPLAYENAKNGPQDLMNCFQSIVNYTQLESEIKEARPNGELDTVFKKYCRKIPTFKTCVKNFTQTIDPCLEPKERDSIDVIHSITSSLLQFICENEGDRIAMFIAGGGKECLTSKQDKINICANDTFHSYLPKNNPAEAVSNEPIKLPNLILTIRECIDVVTFQQCSVKILEDCSDPTPANVVDSLLSFVIKATPCEGLLAKHSTPVPGNLAANAGTGGAASVVLSVTAAMAASLKFL